MVLRAPTDSNNLSIVSSSHFYGKCLFVSASCDVHFVFYVSVLDLSGSKRIENNNRVIYLYHRISII